MTTSSTRYLVESGNASAATRFTISSPRPESMIQRRGYTSAHTSGQELDSRVRFPEDATVFLVDPATGLSSAFELDFSSSCVAIRSKPQQSSPNLNPPSAVCWGVPIPKPEPAIGSLNLGGRCIFSNPRGQSPIAIGRLYRNCEFIYDTRKGQLMSLKLDLHLGAGRANCDSTEGVIATPRLFFFAEPSITRSTTGSRSRGRQVCDPANQCPVWKSSLKALNSSHQPPG